VFNIWNEVTPPPPYEFIPDENDLLFGDLLRDFFTELSTTGFISSPLWPMIDAQGSEVILHNLSLSPGRCTFFSLLLEIELHCCLASTSYSTCYKLEKGRSTISKRSEIANEKTLTG